MAHEPLLAVRDLVTEFRTEKGPLRAVSGVSLTIFPGQTLGIVGESGCGKSVTALSILRLIPDPPGRIVGGQVLFHGEDLLTVDQERLRELRGDRIAMVFQEPMSALNPVFTVGEQVAEVVRVHRGASSRTARQQVVDLFRQVGIPSPEERFSAHPHQLSGGLRQRVVLAMALICEPELLIADEPTSALDTTLQAQIMDLMRKLSQSRQNMATMLISHDLSLVAEACDRVVILYAGQVVEEAPARPCFETPAHPYTAALLRSIGSFAAGGGRLFEIPGAPPDLRSEFRSTRSAPKGREDPEFGLRRCRFLERCDRARQRCREQPPPLEERAPDRLVRCFYPLDGA
jgi:peptide/nickel transport system ATP-binding protein